MPRTALLIGAAIVGTLTTFSAWTGGTGLGIGPADAAQHETRKKTGSRWTARKAVRGAARRGGGHARRGRAAQRRSPSVASPPSERNVAATTAGATLAIETGTVAPPPPLPPSLSGPDTTTGSITRSAETIVRHASDLPPPDRVIATASIGMLHPTPGLDKMRTGLEERARAIRAAIHPLALPLPEPAPAARMVARSITFDLARGERTIVFENGETITAPFDRTMASDLTGFNAAPR